LGHHYTAQKLGCCAPHDPQRERQRFQPGDPIVHSTG
jgi:hypothetical protein